MISIYCYYHVPAYHDCLPVCLPPSLRLPPQKSLSISSHFCSYSCRPLPLSPRTLPLYSLPFSTISSNLYYLLPSTLPYLASPFLSTYHQLQSLVDLNLLSWELNLPQMKPGRKTGNKILLNETGAYVVSILIHKKVFYSSHFIY